jgi:hypothetical protein
MLGKKLFNRLIQEVIDESEKFEKDFEAKQKRIQEQKEMLLHRKSKLLSQNNRQWDE